MSLHIQGRSGTISGSEIPPTSRSNNSCVSAIAKLVLLPILNGFTLGAASQYLDARRVSQTSRVSQIAVENQQVVDLISSYILTADPQDVPNIMKARCIVERGRCIVEGFSSETAIWLTIEKDLKVIAGLAQFFRTKVPHFVHLIVQTEYRVSYKSFGMTVEKPLRYYPSLPSRLHPYRSERRELTAKLLGLSPVLSEPRRTIYCHVVNQIATVHQTHDLPLLPGPLTETV